MAQLVVRNLDDAVVDQLKQRAASAGHSAEEEHRRILRRALLGDGFVDFLLEMPDVGEGEDFARDADLPREVEL